jgi:hypothetical protein
MRVPAPRAARWAAVLAAVAVACHKTGPSNPDPITNFLTGASASAAGPVFGAQKSGSPPAPANGPSLLPGSSIKVTNRGVATMPMQASAPFRQVYVTVNQVTNGVTGFFQIDLPSAVAAESLALNFGASLPANFGLEIQLGSDAGIVGPKATVSVDRVAPGSACTSATMIADQSTLASGATITLTISGTAPANCRWIATEGDAIPFNSAVNPNPPWAFSSIVPVFVGNQVLQARVSNTAIQNPAGTDQVAGIHLFGVDENGVAAAIAIANVVFTITK